MKVEWKEFEAVFFDLDGVLTDSARVHTTCWKQLFDEYLEARAARLGEAFVPFDPGDDYIEYVDGKARIDGTRDFLASRGIELPEGQAGDPPETETIHGLSKRKDGLFVKVLRSQGIEAYETSRTLVQQLRRAGIRTAVVSSSHNCEEVLEVAGMGGDFDARVDGVVIDEMGLNGKPAPDCFLEAARRLDVAPERGVVIEEALSGVQAGVAGAFGLVIGVARKGNADALREHGAQVVVEDLGELPL